MSQINRIIPVNVPLRLVSADEVKNIICKYENKVIQRTMIYEIEKLNGCIATEEQAAELLGNEDIVFEEQEFSGGGVWQYASQK